MGRGKDGGIVSSDDLNLNGSTSTQTSLVIASSVVTGVRLVLVLGMTNSRTTRTNTRTERVSGVRPRIGAVVGLIVRDGVRPLRTLDVVISRIFWDRITTNMTLFVDTDINLDSSRPLAALVATVGVGTGLG